MWNCKRGWNQHNLPRLFAWKLTCNLDRGQEVNKEVQARKIQRKFLKTKMCSAWATGPQDTIWSLRSYWGRTALGFLCYRTLPWSFAAGHCQVWDSELDGPLAQLFSCPLFKKAHKTISYLGIHINKIIEVDLHCGNICWVIVHLRWSWVMEATQDSITAYTGSLFTGLKIGSK